MGKRRAVPEIEVKVKAPKKTKKKSNEDNSKISKNNEAWNKLFEEYDIVEKIEEDGFFKIKASDIKKYREPRLMCKFDHKTHLPDIFKLNQLSILPLSRTEYIIGKFDIFSQVEYNKDLKPIPKAIPQNIETIDVNNLYSESAALHCAHVSGMLEDLLKTKVNQTVSGRMGSGEFNFKIVSNEEKIKIDVKGSQIEIDGGYEGDKQFIIVEAKKESVTDFNVRQLFYPYRVWKNKINKDVTPVFFTFSNDVFSFFIYKFNDEEVFNSIELVQQIDYVVSHDKITVQDIKEAFAEIKQIDEPEVPFPQANSFTRLIDLLGLLVNEDLDKATITENYSFDARQTDYYVNAGVYLGLIKKDNGKDGNTYFSLTKNGREIMHKPFKIKYLEIFKQIVQHEVFYKVFAEFFDKPTIDIEAIVDIMNECTLYNVNSESTIRRRASTVKAWMEWINTLPNK